MFGNWPNRFYPVTENNGTMIDAFFMCLSVDRLFLLEEGLE